MSKGNRLAKELSLDVEQALYSDWGNFYAPIRKYPCVLFDANGYVLLKDENDLGKNGIKVGSRTNVRKRIASLPDYKSIKSVIHKLPEEIDENIYAEGSCVRISINRYERDKGARLACLSHWGFRCQGCGLEMKEVYGKIAEGYIHVHHIKPLSDIKAEYAVDPLNDLVPLCPNCHAVVHLRKPPLTIEELKEKIQLNKG